MGLIEEEIKELRQMVKRVDEGKIAMEEVKTKLNIYKETNKRARLLLDVAIACNRSRSVEKNIHSINLLNKGGLIK